METKSRRVRHGEEFWLEHILACERAGGGVKAYALEHDLGEQNFYKWRRRLSQRGAQTKKQSSPLFCRLGVVQAVTLLNENRLPHSVDETGGLAVVSDAGFATISNCCIRLPNGAALEVGGALSFGLIGQLLQIAGSLPTVANRVVR